MSHFIHICEEHGRVMAQCRCPSKDKVVKKIPHDSRCDTYGKAVEEMR